MRNIQTLLLESIAVQEEKHDRQEIDNLQFKVSCIMSNFPYSEYKGKEDTAVKLVTESIVKFLSEVFSEYKEKIEVNAKRIISQGLSKMFKQYIPVKTKAEELWKSGDGFSDEGFKIGQQEQKMIDYMIKAVKNYIEKIYNFANKEAEKDGKKVSESFEEFCEMLFEKLDTEVNFLVEARSNEITWLLTFEDFKDYLDRIYIPSLLKHTGLDSVIDKKDEARYSSAMEKFSKAAEDLHSFRWKSVTKNTDWRKEPQYDEKELEQKNVAYDDALKNLYKLLCELTDKYDADYPEEDD